MTGKHIEQDNIVQIQQEYKCIRQEYAARKRKGIRYRDTVRIYSKNMQ